METRRARIGGIDVRVHSDRRSLGEAAGRAAAERLRSVLAARPRARAVFASAASQVEFLEQLSREPGIDWGRVEAFHLDEYLGLPVGHPRSFGRFLKDRLFDRVGIGRAHFMDGMADAAAECGRYGRLLGESPLDVACIGIGENGHLAFNDPHVADFEDPAPVKVVEPDAVSRQQQVNEKSMPALEEMPRRAYTMTMPAILAARAVYCMVPGKSKAEAVRRTLSGPISTACPASALRRHPDATLFLDEDSAERADTSIAGR
jgi:glucosamine-6-phosphate deaminase